MTRLSLILWAFQIWALLASMVLGGPIEATYRVAVSEGNGVTAYGTGTAISDKHLVTNSHVVGHRLADCTVYNSLGSHRGTVIAADRRPDLAIVYVRAGGLSPVDVAKSDPQPGDKVSIYGFGMHGILRYGQGTVQPERYQRYQGIALIETDLVIQQGDSGSGLFNADGELCGVQWGASPTSAATGVSHLDKLAQTWETQCGGGQCLPWRGGGIGVGGHIGIYGGRPLVPVQPPQRKPPQQPAQPPAQPPAVQQPACNCTPAKPCQCDPQALVAVKAQLDASQQNAQAIRVQLDALAASLKDLAGQHAKPSPGPAGPRGERGPAGPLSDTGQIVDEVIKRLPPTPAFFEIKPRSKR